MIFTPANDKTRRDSGNSTASDEALLSFLELSYSSSDVASSSCSYPSIPVSFFDPLDDPFLEPRPIGPKASNKDHLSQSRPRGLPSNILSPLYSKDHSHSSLSMDMDIEIGTGNGTDFGQHLNAVLASTIDIAEVKRKREDASSNYDDDQFQGHDIVDSDDMSCDLLFSHFSAASHRTEVSNTTFAGW
ncbi:unnamed protein product [Cylindrotheca closterium]|uniref:Uncharacterized protein n=1 Tax=Cylindrotheca closterium TaxID=2856 RepID=A0AAD2G0K4_9STRA|nr:unnamed protein product [Cylindrotheca closterium]